MLPSPLVITDSNAVRAAQTSARTAVICAALSSPADDIDCEEDHFSDDDDFFANFPDGSLPGDQVLSSPSNAMQPPVSPEEHVSAPPIAANPPPLVIMDSDTARSTETPARTAAMLSSPADDIDCDGDHDLDGDFFANFLDGSLPGDNTVTGQSGLTQESKNSADNPEPVPSMPASSTSSSSMPSRPYNLPDSPFVSALASASLSTSSTSSSHTGKRKLGERDDVLQPSRPSKIMRTATPIVDEPSILRDIQGEELDLDTPVFIAHDPHLQRCFDKRKLSYGVQWEIARLISCRRLHYCDIVITDLDLLKGPNSKTAPMTGKVLGKKPARQEHEQPWKESTFAKEMAAKSPWEELDREEEALRLDPCGGLGFNECFPGWYGGKIKFGGTLKIDGSSNAPHQYTIELDRPELGSSSRFTRRFGSRQFIRVKIPKRVLNSRNNGLVQYFGRPFVIGCRIFRAFYFKDSSMFLAETNEVVADAGEVISCGKRDRLSLWDFLQWHNPLAQNLEQNMAKWSTRFALGFSNSVPGLRLEPSDIIIVPDVVSSQGSDMSDGSGLVNKVILQRLWNKYDWHTVPTTIQCRLAGAKGLLLRHPDDHENDRDIPRAWLRPSQIKITYPKDVPDDPAMLIIDVLRSSHMRSPARLSSETMINFAENGVPHSAFINLLRDGLEEHVTGFLNWEGHDAMFDLWCNVARAGGVMSARLARENSGEARARGYGEYEPDDDELEDEDGLEFDGVINQRSTPWWADETSGCPSSIEETVMALLDAGFTPQNCTVLRDKLKQVILNVINRYVLRRKIDVPMSCTAFLVPDPYGVLAPDEVQIKSPHHNLKTADRLETDIILGPILVTRNPCKLPSDTQKVNAVEKMELRNYTGVIVCSVQGYRRFADFLAGGDYDGDKGLAIWDPALVEPFKNADIKFAEEPAEVSTSFSRSNEKVAHFLERSSHMPMGSKIRELQKYLFGAMHDMSLIGKYSTYHDKAIYHLGYDHPSTIRLGYMFCKVLDRYKTGLVLLSNVERSDAQKFDFNGLGLEWKETEEEKERRLAANLTTLTRKKGLGRFVMDVIKEEAKIEGNRQRARLDTLFPMQSSLGTADTELIAPWTDALKLADRYQIEEGSPRRHQDLQRIADHVHTVYAEHRSRLKAGLGSPKTPGVAFTDLPIVTRQDIFRALSQRFVSGPLASEVLMAENEIARLRASYAYVYDSKEAKSGWSRFPFDVAMRELCAIKAEACGPWKATTEAFYTRFSIRQSSHRRS